MTIKGSIHIKRNLIREDGDCLLNLMLKISCSPTVSILIKRCRVKRVIRAGTEELEEKKILLNANVWLANNYQLLLCNIFQVDIVNIRRSHGGNTSDLAQSDWGYQ